MAYYYYGGSGADYLVGSGQQDVIHAGEGGDWVFAASGDDYVYGEGGRDYLAGGWGVDVLSGGTGNDTLNGGGDGDWIYTGDGGDQIVFHFGDSGTSWATADSVMDYDPMSDWVDADIAGTSRNYVEFTVPYNIGMDQAAGYAMFQFGSGGFWGNPNTNHCFVTDGVNGYLFSDLNGDHVMDSGLELQGIHSLNQFNWSDII
jgi:Ca2+-binding RTX toxin-like protein